MELPNTRGEDQTHPDAEPARDRGCSQTVLVAQVFRDSSDGRSYCLIQKCSQAGRALPHLNAPVEVSFCQSAPRGNGVISETSALRGTDPRLLLRTDLPRVQVCLTRRFSQGIINREGPADQPSLKHPSLCSTEEPSLRPTCSPWGIAASGGQGWPAGPPFFTARSVLEGRSLRCQAVKR